ncbi:MAG: O-antigen ligase family protein [bacterium]|nr:O-antigen ligase family protein [bacterium]
MMEKRLQKIIYNGLCLLLLLAPWQIYFPLRPGIYLSVAQVLAVILFFIWLFSEGRYGHNRKIAGRQYWPVVLILAMILSLTVAVDYILSFKYLLKWSVPIMLFFITSGTIKDTVQAKDLLKIAVWAALPMVLLGLLEFFAGFNRIFNYVNAHKGLVGIFTGPGALQAALGENMFSNKMNWFYWMPDIWQYWVRPFGTFIAVSAFTLSTGLSLVFVPLLYQESRDDKIKKMYALSAFVFFITMVLTFARSAWLSLITVVVTYFSMANKMKQVLYIVLIVSVVLILAGTLFGNFSQAFNDRIASLAKEPSAQSRLIIWQQALRIIINRPITGVGLANYDYGLEAFNSPSYIAVPAHNNYLQVWAETGILGLAALLMVILQGLKISYRTYKSNDAGLSILGLCFILMWIWFSIQGIFDTNIFDDKVSMLFWILAGVNAAVYKIQLKAKN